jgi:hypothetical protein
MTPSPSLLKCTGRNAGMPLKFPGEVSLIGESQIKCDQRQLGIFGRNFVDRATEPLHSQEAFRWKASRCSHSPVQRSHRSAYVTCEVGNSVVRCLKIVTAND